MYKTIEELLGQKVTTELYVDNQSAIQTAKNGIFNKRSKHIHVRYHFVQERIRENEIIELPRLQLATRESHRDLIVIRLRFLVHIHWLIDY